MNRCKGTSRAAHETPKYAALWPRREWPGRPHGCPRTVLRNAVLHSTKAGSGSGQGEPQFDVTPSPQSSVLQRTPRQLATAYRRPYARLLPAIARRTRFSPALPLRPPKEFQRLSVNVSRILACSRATTSRLSLLAKSGLFRLRSSHRPALTRRARRQAIGQGSARSGTFGRHGDRAVAQEPGDRGRSAPRARAVPA